MLKRAVLLVISMIGITPGAYMIYKENHVDTIEPSEVVKPIIEESMPKDGKSVDEEVSNNKGVIEQQQRSNFLRDASRQFNLDIDSGAVEELEAIMSRSYPDKSTRIKAIACGLGNMGYRTAMPLLEVITTQPVPGINESDMHILKELFRTFEERAAAGKQMMDARVCR